MTDETKDNKTAGDAAEKPVNAGDATEKEVSAEELDNVTGGTSNAAYYSSRLVQDPNKS